MTLRLMPEESKVRNGPKRATIKANILKRSPASEGDM